MKNFLPICLISLLSVVGYAVPAKKGVRTFTQADGSTISLCIVGDENFHTYVTTDGLAVAKGDDGFFYYRTASGKSKIQAHNVGARTDAEIKFITENQAEMDVPSIAEAMKSAGTIRKAPNRVAKRISQVPTSGSPRVPIILVQYKDYSFKDSNPKETFSEFFTTGSVSALQYFTDQSNGKYTPQFDIYGPVTLTNKRSYYGGNDSQGNDKYVGTMVGEACSSMNSQIDFSQYDNDGDGECDVVIVMYAGDGEASSYASDAADAIWPCQWALSESDYGKSLTLDRIKVDKFAVFNELNGSDRTKIDGIGTFCHEYSHCLDLPDFYDTNYGNHFGMGPWSLMDYGSYNNDGYTPIGYSAYEKDFMGWLDLEEGTENTFYTLPVMNQGDASTDKAVKITNAKDKNEYYILENRAKQGWDLYMPGEGMMITHVTYNQNSWYQNTVNNYSLQRMTIMPADNELKLDKRTVSGETYYTFNEQSLKGDLWPYGNVNELTDTSTPAAKVNTGSYMGKPITEITKNSDGTVSFWLMKSAVPDIATPVEISHTVESSTAASIYWKPGDDANVTYTVEIFKYITTQQPQYNLVNYADFNSSNNWSGTVFPNGNELFIGSDGRKTGYVYSPSFTTADDGIVTVRLKIRSHASGTSVKVSLLDKYNMAQASKVVPITTEYDTYDIVLSGVAQSVYYVKVEASALYKYIYLNTAEIYTGDATSADATVSVADEDKLTFTNITDTLLYVSGLDENETYYYRIKAVPVDRSSYTESAWSEIYQFTLSSTNGVSNILFDSEPAVYFNLQGVRVNGVPTAPGVYIRRQGKTTTKVLVK